MPLLIGNRGDIVSNFVVNFLQEYPTREENTEHEPKQEMCDTNQ